MIEVVAGAGRDSTRETNQAKIYVTESDYMLYFILRFIRSRTAALLIFLIVLCTTVAADSSAASLDRGFQLFYNLDFGRAQEQFASYQQQHADDPMGPVAEAAGLLFSELNRVGLLGTRFSTGIPLSDPDRCPKRIPPSVIALTLRFSAPRRLPGRTWRVILTTEVHCWP